MPILFVLFAKKTYLRQGQRLSGHASVSLLLLLLLAMLTGCTTLPRDTALPSHGWVYAPKDDAELFAQYAPLLVPAMPQKTYNRIGKVAARLNREGREELYVDPDEATYYVQRQDFNTARDQYTNLIYRLHFERVPYRLIPFHLTAGKNGGLFIILTLNRAGEPVLITTVHTCGCYLGFIPTSYLPDNALPEHWDGPTQTVYGERLPARLDYPESFHTNYRPVVFLRSGTHRVMDVSVETTKTMAQNYRLQPVKIRAIESLKQVPINGGTTSFYVTQGNRKGYVKNATKPFEFLFMSWWALDLHVGVDKELGDRNAVGTVFYTSLKPWRQKASDMWRFKDFLEFWGWRL